MTHIDKIQVTKRDGRLEPINLDKIHKVIAWAADGLDNVSVSQVELKSHIQFYEGIKTRDIHETIIKSAADLISETTPDYQYLAARLAIFHLRKIAYNQFEPPHLYDHVKTLTDAGKYDKHILADYSRAEFDELAPPEMVEKLKELFNASGNNGELEVQPGVHHGFAFPERWCYDKQAAERHWERLIALYIRCLS